MNLHLPDGVVDGALHYKAVIVWEDHGEPEEGPLRPSEQSAIEWADERTRQEPERKVHMVEIQSSTQISLL